MAVVSGNEPAEFTNKSPIPGIVAGTSGVFNGQSYSTNSQQASPTSSTGGGNLAENLKTANGGIFSGNPTGDPAKARLISAKINPGGESTNPKTNISTNGVNFVTGVTANDWRVRISISPNAKILYNAPDTTNGILAPLLNTSGVIFPYVPAVTVSYAARYGTQQLTHSNYNNYFYEGSEVQAISISADFSVQNTVEAAYFLASLYFFRAATKMFYGNSGTYQGSPPPIVYLDGYGAHYLPHVPCVIQQFSHTMPSDVDYIETSAGGQTNRVPTASQFTVSLQPVYSRTSQTKFNYDSFARGDLIFGTGKTFGYL
jgi:hypothetical protein